MGQRDPLAEAAVVTENSLGIATFPAGAGERALAAVEAARRRGIHVLQVEVPSGAEEVLLAHGFRVCPTDISWVAEPGTDLGAFLSRQSPAQRQRSRKALRQLAAFQVRHDARLSTTTFDEWLSIYRANIARMRFGVDFAGDMRDELLRSDRTEMVVVRSATGELVAGVVLADDPDRSILAARFSAVRADLRGLDLPRALYLSLVDLARERSRRLASLGSEPNIYGHLARAGLAAYKLRLGFSPVSRQAIGGRSSRTVLARVLSIAGLTEPVMSFAYPAGTTAEDYVRGAGVLQLIAYTPGGAPLPARAPATASEIIAV
jgi:GNAT superfamily N-acetyltransferase